MIARRDLIDSHSWTTYAVAWYSSFGPPDYVFGLSDVSHTAEVLADPSIETISFD